MTSKGVASPTGYDETVGVGHSLDLLYAYVRVSYCLLAHVELNS